MAFVKWFTTYFMYNNLREQFIDEGIVTKNLPSRCAHRCLVLQEHSVCFQRIATCSISVLPVTAKERVRELVWSKLLYKYI